MRPENDHARDRDGDDAGDAGGRAGDDQPLFIRQRYGSRWVYNHRNPMGLALIVITPIIAIGALLLMTRGAGR
ncbi:hypothetical protein [Streptomyces hiroshimensis]|uniref:Uncharacterized protein n=1 Tax=Streptomyces hiroshimensis TaxID=66424 RepID=A0ABQ2YKU7_9ACTN|nr:hypothetical protein [Streptomyces hiroshimensis]GGX85584.1 hypothetical protein GCM10010324_34310 [Streptomyces hiroshimensis]